MAQPSVRSGSSRSLPALIAGCALLAVCVLVVGAGGAGAWFLRARGPAPSAPPSVEYVLDASPRMLQAAEGGTRLSVAQGVLAEIVRPASPAVAAGLRVFGTGPLPGLCQDTDLLVPLAPADQTQISDRLNALQGNAGGDSAMGVAMVAAIRDLAAARGPHSLVVVTGGADLCDPQAGQLIAQEAARQRIQLQLFVVGFEVSSTDAQGIQGVVDQTTGGTFIQANNAADLRRTLGAIQTFVDKPNGLSVVNVVGTAAATAGGPSSTAVPGTPLAGPTSTALDTGALQLTVLGYGGQLADTNGRLAVRAFTPQDHQTVLATSVDNPAALRLPAGRYDVQVSYWVTPSDTLIGGADEVWLNGLSIQSGLTTTQQYDYKLGEVGLTVLEAAGKPAPEGNFGFEFRIFHPGDLTSAVAWVLAKPYGRLQLAQGTYQVQVDFPGTDLVQQDQSAQTFEVKAGQSLDYTIDLKLGRIEVEVDDDSGQAIDPMQVNANAYPAGTADRPFAYSARTNPADLTLQAGKSYDLVLTLDNGQKLTLTGQQVQEGETKLIKVKVGDFK